MLLILALIAPAAGFCKDIRDKRSVLRPLTKYTVDAGYILGGTVNNVATGTDRGNYPDPVVYYPGTTTFGDWKLKGAAHAQFSYFFGLKMHFGIGIGVMYAKTAGNMTRDTFRVEYRETDQQNNMYRQLLTMKTPLSASLNFTSISIPIVAKYQVRLSNRLTFTADAGIVVNLAESAKYTTTGSSYDFEAIYKFVPGGGAVYDNAVTPAAGDWYVTRDGYSATHTSATIASVFDTLRQKGYNVALNVQPNNTSGKVNFKPGSIGLLLRPTLALNFPYNISVTIGGYLMTQTVHNSSKSNDHVIDINGKSTSPLSTTTSVTSTIYGLDLGIRYSFGW